jgi:hypothetical protein
MFDISPYQDEIVTLPFVEFSAMFNFHQNIAGKMISASVNSNKAKYQQDKK